MYVLLLFVSVRKRDAPTGEVSEVRRRCPRHLRCLGPVDLKVAGPRSSPWAGLISQRSPNTRGA
jgi:hypothetical protein